VKKRKKKEGHSSKESNFKGCKFGRGETVRKIPIDCDRAERKAGESLQPLRNFRYTRVNTGLG
jgi:hypothetical protein